jgi:hypothetical protein
VSEICEVEAPEVDTNDPLEMCAGGGGSQELSQVAESSTVNGKAVGSSVFSMICALGPFSSHNRHPVIGCEWCTITSAGLRFIIMKDLLKNAALFRSFVVLVSAASNTRK